MRLSFILINYLVLFFSAFQTTVLSEELPKGRAIWVWNSNYMIDNLVTDTGNARDELYEFCSSPHGNTENRINVLFLGCKNALLYAKSSLRDFIKDAGRHGLTIEYLGGDPTWATYNQSNGYKAINNVIEFNANTADDSAKIAGIQFDVEPYLLKASRGYSPPYWDTDRDSVWSLFVDFADSCQRLVDSTNTNLYFGIAIPRWYENHVGNNELKRLQSKIDYTAIMDYNEKALVIISDAQNEINNASELNKRVWIGVETKDVSPEPETVSFHEEGVLFMEEALTEVVDAYGSNPVFSGIAIHAYKYYKDLPLSTVIEEQQHVPSRIRLFQNSGNPVSSTTVIRYQLPTAMHVELSVFNTLGQKVQTLVNSIHTRGISEISWNPNGYPPGIYFYRLVAGNETIIKKMLLVR